MKRLAIILCAVALISAKCRIQLPQPPAPTPAPTAAPCPACDPCPPCPPPCPPTPEPTPVPPPGPAPDPPATCPAGVENISIYVHAKGDAGGSSGQSWAAVLDATIKANGAWCRAQTPPRVHCPIPDRCVEEVSGPPVFESVRPLPGRETACLIIPSDNEWMPKVTGWCVMRIYAQRQPNTRTLCEIDEAVEGAATCWQEE